MNELNKLKQHTVNYVLCLILITTRVHDILISFVMVNTYTLDRSVYFFDKFLYRVKIMV